MRLFQLGLVFLVTIIIADQFGFCRRTGFDNVPNVELPPRSQALSSSEQAEFYREVTKVVKLCDSRPETWEGTQKAQRVYRHRGLPRFLATLERLLHQANDSSTDWKIIAYETEPDKSHGDVIACPGKVLFVNTPFFAEEESEEVIAVRLSHALGHAFAGHRCWQPMTRSGIVLQQRALDEVSSSLCRNVDQAQEWVVDEQPARSLRERMNDLMERSAIFLVAWPSYVFGDGATINHQRHEYEASLIGLYLAKHAGFSISPGISELRARESNYGTYCRDPANGESYRFAEQALHERAPSAPGGLSEFCPLSRGEEFDLARLQQRAVPGGKSNFNSSDQIYPDS